MVDILASRTTLGPLIPYVGSTGPRQTGIPITVTVSSVWRRGHWMERSRSIEQMLIHITSIAISDDEVD
ncbi:unnamed protein product [Arabis nemorensis]|uniref:Uncharacterized protein n=1 Tax=Arabis nemorensis TaxID=586526 RepID=A0A565CG84_9BRAS|nr:unnamed protein product [Arabis nemorensis]